MSKDKKVLELRIPWQLLNVKDPSQRLIMSDFWRNGIEGEQKTDGVKIAVLATEKDQTIASFPEVVNGQMNGADSYLFQWKEWEQPNYHERLKASYYIMKEAYKSSKNRSKKHGDREVHAFFTVYKISFVTFFLDIEFVILRINAILRICPDIEFVIC